MFLKHPFTVHSENIALDKVNLSSSTHCCGCVRTTCLVSGSIVRLYTDIRYYTENVPEVVPKSEENVSNPRKTYHWEKLNLRASPVFSGAMTIPIRGPLPSISIFFLMLLAELKTENGNMMCISTAPTNSIPSSVWVFKHYLNKRKNRPEYHECPDQSDSLKTVSDLWDESVSLPNDCAPKPLVYDQWELKQLFLPVYTICMSPKEED